MELIVIGLMVWALWLMFRPSPHLKDLKAMEDELEDLFRQLDALQADLDALEANPPSDPVKPARGPLTVIKGGKK